MNYFSLGAKQIFELIDTYTIKVGVYGLLFALVGLILGLFATRLLKNKEWFKRRSEQRRRLIPIYKFLIPFNLMLFGFLSGGLIMSKDFFEGKVVPTIRPMTKLIFPSYQFFLNSHWELIVKQKLDFDLTVDAYMAENKLDRPSDDLYGGYQKWAADNGMPLVVNWWFKSVVMAAPLNKGQKATGKETALIRARKVNVYGLRRNQWDVFEEFIHYEIASFHAILWRFNLLVFILPIVWILSESYYLKKRREKLAASEA